MMMALKGRGFSVRRNELAFVSGHDFSRADMSRRKDQGFSPGGVPQSECSVAKATIKRSALRHG